MSLINSTAIPSGATAYEIEQSLRFNNPDNAYLSRTFVTPTNRKIFTFSVWLKRSVFGAYPRIFSTATGAGGNTDNINFMNDNTLRFSSDFGHLITTQVFRDPSAWYHIVYAFDSTQSTEANRLKLYVNGTQVTSFGTTNYPTLNDEIDFNSAIVHDLGRNAPESGQNMDGYLAEVNWIDGQAKAPTDFGETGDYGEWKPVEYSGTYGNNGFYLPFKQDYTVEGFSAVTSRGNATAKYVGGVGFQPDFVWNKTRSANQNHFLYDAIRGTGKELRTNQTNAEGTNDGVTAFSSDGFSRGTSNDCNENGQTYVDWCWDMGGSNATNTQGNIQSTVRANTTYGQSIVSYTGTGSSATVGHGLSSKPAVVLTKRRDASGHWLINDWSGDYANKLKLNDTEAPSSSDNFVNAASATTFTLGTDTDVNANNGTYIAYCWNEVSEYSKFGSYTANDSTTNAITTGFRPAWVMIKCTTDGSSDRDWTMFDNTRSPTNTINLNLKANESSEENANSRVPLIDFTDTGFTLKSSHGETNGGTQTYIYMAFADKREYAYWLDQSGNNNDWTSNNLTESDISVDSPTNNFCTWNPLSSIVLPTLSEGNLKNGGENNKAMAGTFGVSTGKWYWEINVLNNSQVAPYIGVTKFSMENDPDVSPTLAASSGRSVYRFRSTPLYKNFTATAYADDSAHGLADYGILGLALDLDNGTLKYYVNNTLYHTDSTIPSDGTTIYPFLTGTFAGGSGWNSAVSNFGQDSSFAGNKTAQGNQDGNSIGDFYYTPPTGFLALCTSNLPDVAVTPSEHFNTVLYTGNGSTQSITNVGFQPNWVWLKNRSVARNHEIYDAIRGATKGLMSNDTDAEATRSTGLTAFNSDGFSLGSHNNVNENTANFVSWNWKAGNATLASNAFTQGSIASTCSRNVDAGFSIVSWTGDGGTGTVGHGLNSAPELWITKDRASADNWLTFFTKVDGSLDAANLNLTNAATAGSVSLPTSSVFTNDGYTNSQNLITYAFHSVDGYSKVGSYTGNGVNLNGPYVQTSFRPAWVMLKRTDSADAWVMFDSAREPENEDDGQDLSLKANASDAEAAYGNIDFLSNGFKVMINAGYMNNSGSTYIYLAFAEVPAKYSNAR